MKYLLFRMRKKYNLNTSVSYYISNCFLLRVVKKRFKYISSIFQIDFEPYSRRISTVCKLLSLVVEK